MSGGNWAGGQLVVQPLSCLIHPRYANLNLDFLSWNRDAEFLHVNCTCTILSFMYFTTVDTFERAIIRVLMHLMFRVSAFQASWFWTVVGVVVKRAT